MRKNFQICYPQLSETEVNQKLQASIKHNACLTKEFATAWLGGRSLIANKFDQVEGSALIDEILDAQKPLIMAVPHIGNWEFFWHWLQFNYRIIGMYQPAKYYGVEKLVLDARQRFGGQVFPTDTKGIMKLFRALKQGKIMMILPDQAPKRGCWYLFTVFWSPRLYHDLVAQNGAKNWCRNVIWLLHPQC